LCDTEAAFLSRDGGTGRRSGLKRLQAAPVPTGEVLSFLLVFYTYEYLQESSCEVR